MSVQTKLELKETTIKKMQELIRANIDAYDGFHESADEISNDRVASLFRYIADERSTLASELQEYVEWNGEEAAKEGTLTAGVHRAWINIRSTLNGGDPYVILAEAERGEDHIKQAYEDVLKETAGSPINHVLLQQYSIVKSGHDKVRDLRDAFKPQS
jgi:uncharacterized protein (TIGR02284 family)